MDKDQAALLNSWMTYAETAIRLLKAKFLDYPATRLDEIIPQMLITRDQWKSLVGLESRTDRLKRPWRVEDSRWGPSQAKIIDREDTILFAAAERELSEALVAAVNAEYEREKANGS